jgi:hypothetical protein
LLSITLTATKEMLFFTTPFGGVRMVLDSTGATLPIWAQVTSTLTARTG